MQYKLFFENRMLLGLFLAQIWLKSLKPFKKKFKSNISMTIFGQKRIDLRKFSKVLSLILTVGLVDTIVGNCVETEQALHETCIQIDIS